MKTLLILAMLLASTQTRAEQIVLTKNSEGEAAVTLLLLMCPTCIVALGDSANHKKEEPKKEPDSKNKQDTILDRKLASEPKTVSK